MLRVYECARCSNRNICEKNNVCVRQCADSIKSEIAKLKYEKERYMTAYKGRMKYLKKMYRQRAK